MWIILTKKLPTQVSPPRLSIHWATTWGLSNPAISQQKCIAEFELEKEGDSYRITYGYSQEIGYIFGLEHDEENALGINYKGERIKVYPDEFNILTPEKMRIFVFGYPDEGMPSHTLIENSDASALLLKTAEETALKDVMEAAMLDGCSEPQALALMLGMDIELATSEFPPVGWFRAKRPYAQIFCSESEMEE